MPVHSEDTHLGPGLRLESYSKERPLRRMTLRGNAFILSFNRDLVPQLQPQVHDTDVLHIPKHVRLEWPNPGGRSTSRLSYIKVTVVLFLASWLVLGAERDWTFTNTLTPPLMYQSECAY